MTGAVLCGLADGIVIPKMIEMEDQVPSGARARAVAPRGKASCRLSCWLIILSSGKAELTRLVLTTAPLEAGRHWKSCWLFFVEIFRAMH